MKKWWENLRFRRYFQAPLTRRIWWKTSKKRGQDFFYNDISASAVSKNSNNLQLSNYIVFRKHKNSEEKDYIVHVKYLLKFSIENGFHLRAVYWEVLTWVAWYTLYIVQIKNNNWIYKFKIKHNYFNCT